MDENKQDSKHLKPKHFWFIGLAIVFLWCLTFVLLWWFDLKRTTGIGQFGDMFGAVNALFSGLAFLGIIYTVNLQRRELELQRQELKDTRAEFETQNETLKLQRFENTFFHLLTQHHQILDNLSFKVGKNVYVKRNVINYFSRTLTNGHNGRYSEYVTTGEEDFEVHTHRIHSVDSLKNGFEAIQQSYARCFDRDNDSILSHYFRNLYHIFKFISQSKEIPKERQQFYASLVVAQLSQEEQLLIFHNMMVPSLGFPKFIFLDKYFDILGNLSKRRLEEHPWQIELFEHLKEELPEDIDLDKKIDLIPKFE